MNPADRDDDTIDLTPEMLDRIERSVTSGWAASSREARALCAEIRRLQAALAEPRLLAARTPV